MAISPILYKQQLVLTLGLAPGSKGLVPGKESNYKHRDSETSCELKDRFTTRLGIRWISNV